MVENRKVIVLGSSHYNTVGVVQSLGKEGLYVICVICGMPGVLTKSIYLREIYLVNSYQEGVEFIAQNLVDKNDTVIIPCGDEAALILDRNSDILKDHFRFEHADKTVGLERAMDKHFQTTIAKHSGFDIPFSIRINKTSASLSEKSIVFPCIIKPLLSCEGDKNDICIARNSEEYGNLISKALERSPRVLVQEFIENKDYELNILGCGMSNGECIIPGSIRKLRIHPKDRGSVSVALVEPISEELHGIIDSIKKMVSSLGYVGLFSIELMCIVEPQKHYFIEMNLRNDALSPFIVKAGCNLPYIHYLDLLGRELPSINEVTRKQTMICEPIHFSSLFHGSISFWDWIKDIIESNSFMLYYEEDKKVFYSQFTSRFSSFLKRIIR